MATINVPDEKVVIVQAFLETWRTRTLAEIDAALAIDGITEAQRQELLVRRAEVDAKTWKPFTWDLLVAQAKLLRQYWARQDAEPQMKALGNQIEADALAELSDL